MRLTVYIPTYNRAHYLAASVASVLGQSYRDFRLVVSDNASTDETTALLAGLSDPRLEHVRLPENIGLLANFNRCLTDATTEYVLILADDDVLYPKHLEETVAVLDRHPHVGMVHTAFDVIGPEGEVVFRGVDWTGVAAGIESGAEFICASLSGWSRVAASTALIRTRAVPEGGFLAADFPPTDFGLWLRLALNWDVAFVDRPLAAYRIHPASHSAAYGTYTPSGYIDVPEHILKGLDVKLRFLGRYGNRFPDARRLRRVARRSAAQSLINRAARQTLPERRLWPAVRLLADAIRRLPRVTLEPAAWRLLAASVLGRRIVARVRARRARREGIGEAAA